MTSAEAFGRDNDIPYPKLRERWLARYLLVEDKSITAIRGILFDASQDAFKEISDLEGKDGVSAPTRVSQLASFMKIARDIDESIFKQIGPVIRNGQKVLPKSFLTVQINYIVVN